MSNNEIKKIYSKDSLVKAWADGYRIIWASNYDERHCLIKSFTDKTPKNKPGESAMMIPFQADGTCFLYMEK